MANQDYSEDDTGHKNRIATANSMYGSFKNQPKNYISIFHSSSASAKHSTRTALSISESPLRLPYNLKSHEDKPCDHRFGRFPNPLNA